MRKFWYQIWCSFQLIHGTLAFSVGLHISRQLSHFISEPSLPLPHCLTSVWMSVIQISYSLGVQNILIQSKKDSTRLACAAKWKRFRIWCECQLQSHDSLIPTILDYLHFLKSLGLSISSFRVHWQPFLLICPSPQIENCSFSLHLTMMQIFKDLIWIFLPIRECPPLWDLNVALSGSMAPYLNP